MAQAVRIEGMEKLEKKLRKVQDKKTVRAALKAAGLHVKGKVAKYPPSSGANAPKGHGGWYERGFGSKYRRLDGQVTARKTSETLGRKWSVKQTRNETRVGNNVSYGPYVQDEGDQASFHKGRGWKTIQTVAKEEAPEVVKFVKKAVDKALES